MTSVRRPGTRPNRPLSRPPRSFPATAWCTGELFRPPGPWSEVRATCVRKPPCLQKWPGHALRTALRKWT
eukprot:12558802-Alexandrium_andersonii.AAC.1